MQRVVLAILVAFVCALAAGPLLIPFLKRLKFGQNVRSDGPQSHLVKQGTPTMGGFLIIFATIVAAILFSKDESRWDFLLLCLLATVSFAVIGFADDYIKVVKKRSMGLNAKQKIFWQFVLAVGFAVWLYRHPQVGSSIIIPFAGINFDLGIWYIPFAAFIFIATPNSANLMDGLDGLLGGVTLIDMATFSILCLFAAQSATSANLANLQNMGVFAGALTGACLGFLRFNTFPAKIIMGDTGSMALGGAICMVALLLRQPLLLVIMAFMLVLTTVSDIIQIGVYKRTKKRVFRMAPLHHHFELSGVPETKIVSMYMIITALLCLLSLLGAGLPVT